MSKLFETVDNMKFFILNEGEKEYYGCKDRDDIKEITQKIFEMIGSENLDYIKEMLDAVYENIRKDLSNPDYLSYVPMDESCLKEATMADDRSEEVKKLQKEVLKKLQKYYPKLNNKLMDDFIDEYSELTDPMGEDAGSYEAVCYWLDKNKIEKDDTFQKRTDRWDITDLFSAYDTLYHSYSLTNDEREEIKEILDESALSESTSDKEWEAVCKEFCKKIGAELIFVNDSDFGYETKNGQLVHMYADELADYLETHKGTLSKMNESEQLTTATVYQIKNVGDCNYAFMNYDFAKDKLNMDDYQKIATISVEENDNIMQLLDHIFELGNLEKSKFDIIAPMRSISVSDIIELNGVKYYVDDLGFKEIENNIDDLNEEENPNALTLTVVDNDYIKEIVSRNRRKIDSIYVDDFGHGWCEYYVFINGKPNGDFEFNEEELFEEKDLDLEKVFLPNGSVNKKYIVKERNLDKWDGEYYDSWSREYKTLSWGVKKK